ncbi:MAG: hypothetical protein ACLUSP_05405 [Christensenellales bacterium]
MVRVLAGGQRCASVGSGRNERTSDSRKFLVGINHYQLATHFEIGTVYGETASGEK